MKKIYQIEIEEILQNVYEIEADSVEEALDIAEERYRNLDYVLDYNCLQETNFREYKDFDLNYETKKIKDLER